MKFPSVTLQILGLVSLAVVVGCGIFDSDSGPQYHPTPILLTGIEPCVVQAGKPIRLYGLLDTGPVTALLGNTPLTVGNKTSSYVDLEVPAGASGTTLSISQGTRVGFLTVTMGSLTSVPEVEPNDDINGTNATDAAMNRVATGSLSSVSDKDHFKFGCVNNKDLEIEVNPKVVSTVFLNGTGVALDTNGRARFRPTTDTILVGLTGGTGAYTITLRAAGP